jgi:hypothetical protein
MKWDAGLMMMNNSATHYFLVRKYANQIVKVINTNSWTSIRSANPLKNGFVT